MTGGWFMALFYSQKIVNISVLMGMCMINLKTKLIKHDKNRLGAFPILGLCFTHYSKIAIVGTTRNHIYIPCNGPWNVTWTSDDELRFCHWTSVWGKCHCFDKKPIETCWIVFLCVFFWVGYIYIYDIYIYICIYIYTDKQIYIYTYIHIYIVCIHIYIYTCIHIYIYTYIHIPNVSVICRAATGRTMMIVLHWRPVRSCCRTRDDVTELGDMWAWGHVRSYHSW